MLPVIIDNIKDRIEGQYILIGIYFWLIQFIFYMISSLNFLKLALCAFLVISWCVSPALAFFPQTVLKRARTTFHGELDSRAATQIYATTDSSSESSRSGCNGSGSGSSGGVTAQIGKLVRGETLYEFDDIGVRRQVSWADDSVGFKAPNGLSIPLFRESMWRIFVNTFVPPEKMGHDYYNYTYWRMAQRLLSAQTSVFGTQSLLMALGIKQDKLGIAAATTWVLKDALGKCSRMFWASQHGRRFDVDAKRWRFRSAILFATGNALEIITFIFPPMFLLLAASANALKQMAMLTSSATRNTIYKSFARKANNIGNITAKGEAQIAVIDLLGMFLGVAFSKMLGMSRWKIATAFLVLSAGDIFCIYNEIRSVCFASLNYERTGIVLGSINRMLDDEHLAQNSDENLLPGVPTPETVAQSEKLLLSSKYGEEMFRSWSSMDGSVHRLNRFMEVFDPKEKFVITLDAKVINVGGKLEYQRLVPQVLLHTSATHFDVFRVLCVVHRADFLLQKEKNLSVLTGSVAEDKLLSVLRESYAFTKRFTRGIVNGLRTEGWDMGKFTYGSIMTRVEWATRGGIDETK